MHRVLSKSYSDGTPAVTYGYDGNAPQGCSPTLSASNPVGRRTGMCDAAGWEAWSFDAMGRVLTDRRTTNGVTRDATYSYNFMGSPTSITYPSGTTLTYAYDAVARPLSAVDSARGINYALSASYAPQGALASLVLGQSGTFTGISLNQGYNSRLQPTSIRAWSTNGTPLDLGYDFRLGAADNGNVTKITNNLNNDRTQFFTYDGLNRIATAKTQAATGPYAWGLQFGYDAWANLLAETVTQGSAPMLSVAAGVDNRLLGYSYDAAGNMLNDGSFSYSYDAENRMTSAAGVGYTYDGDGKRVQKSNGKLYWYGVGSAPLTETDLAGNNPVEYVFFGGQRIARRDSSGTISYYFADHLGSARVVTNATGTVLDDSDFYPFGGERPVVSSSGNTYKFTSKERDSESGLDNSVFRYYGSTVGRFISPDPINLTARRLVNPANTLNKYVYGGNNPLLYVDPDGLDITVFYRQGQFGNVKDYGHIFIAATNQQTGKVKFLDFYPQGSKTVLNQNMTAERLNQHAAITIQTTPEVAQKVVDFIEKLEKNTPDYDALNNNCTTICQEAMAIVGIHFPGGIFPGDLWNALYAQYSDEALSDREALSNPFFAPLPRYQPGVDFGRTSFLPRGGGFSVFDLFSLMLRSQSQPKKKGTACVTTQGPKGRETTCEPN